MGLQLFGLFNHDRRRAIHIHYLSQVLSVITPEVIGTHNTNLLYAVIEKVCHLPANESTCPGSPLC